MEVSSSYIVLSCLPIYLLDKYLEKEFLSQRVNAFVFMTGIAL